MKIKYYKRISRADGSINHFIGVPTYIHRVTGDESFSFDDLASARAYSLKVQAKYASHLRNNRKSRNVSAGTVYKLVEYYRESENYANLKPRSIASYELMINTALNIILPNSNQTLGDMESSSITKEVVQRFIRQVRSNFSHHRALHTVKVMKLIWTVAENAGKVSGNPWRHSQIKNLPDREVLWTQDQVDTFIATADSMGLHSMGTLALMCYTMCQRPGDVRKLRWEDIKKDIFEFKQEKTGTEVFIPLAPVLKKRLSQPWISNKGRNKLVGEKFSKGRAWDTILTYEVTGKPYTQWDYAKIARSIMRKANLPKELRIGDLRRTGTTKLADSGCTEDQIMSVTGHKSREMVSVYVKRSRETAQHAITQAWGQ